MFKKNIYLIAALALAMPFIAKAENDARDSAKTYQIPSVTVTTTRAVERINPVPFSEISVKEIKLLNTSKDLPMFLSDMPSMLVYSEGGNGIGYTNLSMRGFNQRRIAVMVNGIPQNDPEDHNVYWIDMPDLTSSLENIQIQRGAGMSNYGAAAIGGSINLTTANIGMKRGTFIGSGFGFQEFGYDESFRHNVSRFSIEAASGIVDNQYAFYAKLSKINSFGYREKAWANLNSYFVSIVRFDGELSTQINVFGGPLADGLSYTGIPKSYVKDKKLRRSNYNYWNYDSTGKELSWITPRRSNELENFDQPHFEILNDWNISSNMIFKSSLFYYYGEGFFDYDGSGWTDKNSFRLTPENGFPNAEDPQNPIIRSYVLNKHGGWIPRLIIKHEQGELTIGAEYRIHRSDHWGKLSYAENLPKGYDPNYKFYQYDGARDIYSLFVREQYNLNSNLILNADLQYVHHSYRIDNEKAGKNYTSYTDINGKVITNGAEIFDIRYNFINPRIGLNYNIDAYQNAYFAIAVTSREPRMVNLYNASEAFTGKKPLFEGDTVGANVRYDFEKPLIKPERMFDLELGYNYRNEDYFFAANFYWMKLSNELVKSGTTDIFGNPIDGNAESTTHMGLELQASAMLLRSNYGHLILSANSTISKNNIDEYDFVTGSGEIVSLKDNPISGFPEFIAGARLSYTIADLFVSLSTKIVGEFRTDNFGDMLNTNQVLIKHLRDKWAYYADNKVDSYNIYNLDLSYTFRKICFGESFKVQLQVNNLFNKLYAAGGEGQEFFPAAERNVFVGFELGL